MKRAIFSKCSKADYRGMKLLITMKPIKSKSWCSNCSKNTKIGNVGSTSGSESPVKVRWPKRENCQKKVFSANQEPGKTYTFWRKSFTIIHNLDTKIIIIILARWFMNMTHELGKTRKLPASKCSPTDKRGMKVSEHSKTNFSWNIMFHFI